MLFKNIFLSTILILIVCMAIWANVVNDKKKEAEQLIAREESTKSEAIISLLVNNEFKGFLFFESVDESTFSVDQSTDYLEFFAQVISKHLESLLYK